MFTLVYSISINQLCKPQYQGIITLLPKPGKDILLASNYRPITLLNCDYRIISKFINNKIIPILPALVNNDQTGFIKGRHIGDDIRLMCNIIDYAKFKNIRVAVLSDLLTKRI